MRTTTITATAVTILLGAAIALAAPAAANQANAPTGRVNHDQISLRRDGTGRSLSIPWSAQAASSSFAASGRKRSPSSLRSAHRQARRTRASTGAKR